MSTDFGKKKFFTPVFALLPAVCFMLFSAALFAEEGVPPAAENEEDANIITADLLMPETVCAYSSLRDYPELLRTWETTQWGHMLRIPEMAAARESIVAQMQSQYSDLEARLGVSMTDVFEIASGEIASAVLLLPPAADAAAETKPAEPATVAGKSGSAAKVAPAKGGVVIPPGTKCAMAVLIDVKGREVETQKVLAKIAQRVTAGGGKHTKHVLSNADVHYLDIVLPAEKAVDGTAKPAKPAAPVMRRVIYVLKDNWLLASDDKDVVRAILERMEAVKSGEMLPSLADVTGYLNVLERCVGTKLPDIVWYTDPVRYAVVARLRQLEKNAKNVRGQDVPTILRESGFDGVEAVGGFITLKTEGYECVVRTFVSIPKPPSRSLKMLSFPAGSDFTPPAWVPKNASACLVLNLDYMTLFDHLGPVFNQFYGEGDDGVWDDVKEGLKDDPYGPQVDLREQIFKFFGKNMVFFVENQKPETPDAERRMLVIPLTNGKLVHDALTRLLEKEEGIQVKQTPNGTIWTYSEPAGRKNATQKERPQLFPELAITVHGDYLVIASHGEYLTSFDFTAADGLGGTKKYQQITDELNRFVGEKRSSQDYFDMETQYHHIFLMFKDGTLPKSTAVSARLLNGMFSDAESGGSRKAMVDAKSLPDYDVVRPFFSTGGSTLTEVEKGYLLEGIYLSAEKAEK